MSIFTRLFNKPKGTSNAEMLGIDKNKVKELGAKLILMVEPRIRSILDRKLGTKASELTTAEIVKVLMDVVNNL